MKEKTKKYLASITFLFYFLFIYVCLKRNHRSNMLRRSTIKIRIKYKSEKKRVQLKVDGYSLKSHYFSEKRLLYWSQLERTLFSLFLLTRSSVRLVITPY
jgi:hypothetical protein